MDFPISLPSIYTTFFPIKKKGCSGAHLEAGGKPKAPFPGFESFEGSCKQIHFIYHSFFERLTHWSTRTGFFHLKFREAFSFIPLTYSPMLYAHFFAVSQ